MSKFNLNQLLGGGSKGGGGETRSSDQGYKITHIPIQDLEPSKDNFYSVEQITELKASIAAFGVKQNLIVAPTANGKYRVIAGHRRRLAVISLIGDGRTDLKTIPCIVETEEDELRERLLLITTNSTTRILSDWEKIKQAKELKGVLEQIKKRDKIPGRLRDMIASTLDTSPAQVGRMEAIDKNLNPAFKEELKEGRINMSTAYEISGMTPNQQQEAYEEYRERGAVSIKDAKDKKQEAQDTNKPEQPSDEDAEAGDTEPKTGEPPKTSETTGSGKGNPSAAPIEVIPVEEAMEEMRKMEGSETPTYPTTYEIEIPAKELLEAIGYSPTHEIVDIDLKGGVVVVTMVKGEESQ